MILFHPPEHLPDIGYIFCALNRIPSVVLDADGPLWAAMCVSLRETKLAYRSLVEPVTGDTGFMIFEPPNISMPLLSCDLDDGAKQFMRMCDKSKGVWMLVLQFRLDGQKHCRVFSVENEQMKGVNSATGIEVWDGWVIENPDTAR